MVMAGHGGGFGGQTATQMSTEAGLPFAGVPEEMREGAKKLLAKEPKHHDPKVRYNPTEPTVPKFGLRQLLMPKRMAMTVGFAMLCLETLTMLVGPVVIQQGIDNGVIAGNTAVLNFVVLVYLAIVAINTLLSYARQRWNGRVAEDLMFDMRLRLFGQYQRLPLDWYTQQKAGVLLSRMTSDVEHVALLVNEGFVNLVIQALTVVVVTSVLVAYNPALAAILLLLVVPPLVFLTLWFRTRSAIGYWRVREHTAKVLSDLSENLAGVRVIAALARHRRNAVHHRRVVGDYRDANISTTRVSNVYGPATEAIGIAAQGAMLAVGGWMVTRGTLTAGELIAFVLFVTTFFAPIQQLVQLYNTYQQGQSGLRKIGELLATQSTVPQSDDAQPLPPIKGRITLKHVSFAYGNETSLDTSDAEQGSAAVTEVLHDVSLDIAAGETFALVGPTGAGKSTIAKLIARFYDPTQGEVAIDGWDLRDLQLDSLRNRLGVVPQEPFLFHGTVRDNVAFAADNISDEEIEAAIDTVGLRDTVTGLPNGLDTLVHERGVSLSAGERQLLALARAFVAKPQVIVLDEATSSLDLRSESNIENALESLLQGRTAVLIAHRLATAMRADRIAVIDDGRVVEQGTHEELVALGGQYAQMFATWESQTGSSADGHGDTGDSGSSASGSGDTTH